MKRTAACAVVSAMFAMFLAAGCGKPVTETGQKMCPVMQKEVNPKIFTEYEGKKIYFCCEQCKTEFAKNPKKYVKIVDQELKKLAEAKTVAAPAETAQTKSVPAKAPAAKPKK
jgi:YHS domain-containing protein